MYEYLKYGLELVLIPSRSGNREDAHLEATERNQQSTFCCRHTSLVRLLLPTPARQSKSNAHSCAYHRQSLLTHSRHIACQCRQQLCCWLLAAAGVGFLAGLFCVYPCSGRLHVLVCHCGVIHAPLDSRVLAALPCKRKPQIPCSSAPAPMS
jgi:hypothetical protein